MRKIWLYFSVGLICWHNSIAKAGVLTGEELTISIGNQQSWTGRNGTGNLSYYGCDRLNSCIYLTGGKITCRDGICRTVWQHQNYSYVLSSPITEAGISSPPPSTLTIYSDSQVVLEEELYPKPFDNLKSQN
ncbi:hypothetical protein IQ255_23955 [Pleurocapsales cyanobacterium LEGE 10410]|nr:hypothetical protein [Pleurocapsales cyanobacterium LEGE 10410]